MILFLSVCHFWWDRTDWSECSRMQHQEYQPQLSGKSVVTKSLHTEGIWIHSNQTSWISASVSIDLSGRLTLPKLFILHATSCEGFNVFYLTVSQSPFFLSLQLLLNHWTEYYKTLYKCTHSAWLHDILICWFLWELSPFYY